MSYSGVVGIFFFFVSQVFAARMTRCEGDCNGVQQAKARWKAWLLPLLVFGFIAGFLWAFFEAEKVAVLRREGDQKIQLFEKRLNFSKSKVKSMAMIFSASDQTCGRILSSKAPPNCDKEHKQNLLNHWLVYLMLIVIVLGSKITHCYRNLFDLSTKQYELQILRQGGRWRKRILFLGIFVGILISVWIYFGMNESLVVRRRETLANMCGERARMLQDQFNVSLNHVNALAILISTFHHGKWPSSIDQKTFADYAARTSFERPLTSGVSYALKVTHFEREQFEKEHGWVIKKMDTEDQSLVKVDYAPEKLDPSPPHDEYAPVVFTQETVSHIVSIDMMSGKEDRDNILRARASGKGVLTSPFNLLKSNKLGVVLTFAVYKSDLSAMATPQDRIDATVGYLGASFDFASLVDRLLHQLASKQTIVINVYDTTNSSSSIKMYGPDEVSSGSETHVSNVDFGDPMRKHSMHCRFKHGPSPPWSAITTSLGVSVIILLIGHILNAAINRIEKVEDDYRKMKELKIRAETADVAKSQFLATVSHEIRTPMNGVLGMLQMLLDTNLDSTQQDFAMTAQASGKALVSLINEVLDQAKIESGKLELETVPFDVRSILDNVLSLFSDKSQAKGIEMAVYVSNQVPEVLIGDPGRFRQVITNLVGNSIKFTEEGHIFVSVHLIEEMKRIRHMESHAIRPVHCPDEKGAGFLNDSLSGFLVVNRRKSWEHFTKFDSSEKSACTINVLVTVEDTGIGISKEAQSRVFTPFMQADSSTSRTYGGTGIGLGISKCLVNLMVGEIGFVSEPAVGSSFSFTAAFKEGWDNPADIKRRHSEMVSAGFHGLRGLVVDGRRIRADVTKYHLQRLGIDAEIATNPKSALSMISNSFDPSGIREFDVILIDKNAWGEGSGLPFARPIIDLKRNGLTSRKNIPKILLLSTSLIPFSAEDIKLAGFSDVVIKPLRLSTMSACIRRTLGIADRQKIGAEKPPEIKSLLSRKRILIVDDNLVNLKVASGALKKYGAIVKCAESGKAAVDLLRPPHEFDACFMDIQMPEIDGFEATRRIRHLERSVNHRRMPILAMTADVFQASHDECLRCGMDGYVSKPFEIEQLYSAVAPFFQYDL